MCGGMEDCEFGDYTPNWVCKVFWYRKEFGVVDIPRGDLIFNVLVVEASVSALDDLWMAIGFLFDVTNARRCCIGG